MRKLICTMCLALTALIQGCFFLDPVLYPEQYAERKAYAAEYNLDKPSDISPKWGLKVYYPDWMADEDKPGCLAMVDSYVTAMVDSYPKAGEFSWGGLWVYLHNECGDKIVCEGWGWVWGWQHGRVIYTPWRPIKDAAGNRVGIAEDNCLIVVPHEFVHPLALWEIGNSDTYHKSYFLRPEIIKMIADGRANAIGCKLSEASKKAALAYVYKPWRQP